MTVAADVVVALDAVLAGDLPADLETEQLDFKQVGRSKSDTLGNLAEAASCFANAHGGSWSASSTKPEDRPPLPDVT